MRKGSVPGFRFQHSVDLFWVQEFRFVPQGSENRMGPETGNHLAIHQFDLCASAERFVLLTGGQSWPMLGSRKNSKPEKCLKISSARTNGDSPLHRCGAEFSKQRPTAQKRTLLLAQRLLNRPSVLGFLPAKLSNQIRLRHVCGAPRLTAQKSVALVLSA